LLVLSGAFDFQPRTQVIFGPGRIADSGGVAYELGFKRTLLVADEGIVRAGHVATATRALGSRGIISALFHDFTPNPDTGMAQRGSDFAATARVDSIVAVGGGSSMDCAKAINFLLTNGGSMSDYRGYGKATRPMLPMIAIPTTAGTGSEAQSYAVISDARTHAKMACGDPGAAFRVAILDPELLVSQPRNLRGIAGCDAMAHAVETWVTTRRNAMSDCFAREAWRLIDQYFERALTVLGDVDAMAGMQIAAHLAGAAIENSMLGATHACANPLTAAYGTTHGIAVGLLLPWVVEWNGCERYKELHPALAKRCRDLARAAGLPGKLADLGVRRTDFPRLAADAAGQWTGQFNPRPLGEKGALEVYECAW
jgi:alcohol dehydrogenase